LGADHGGRADGGPAAGRRLRLPHGLLHRRPHRRRDEGI
ncbi:MAG: Maltose/maltodextrin ABC transporter, permease protein MalG, partial [uncultured Microvirga sp.]